MRGDHDSSHPQTIVASNLVVPTCTNIQNVAAEKFHLLAFSPAPGLLFSLETSLANLWGRHQEELAAPPHLTQFLKDDNSF